MYTELPSVFSFTSSVRDAKGVTILHESLVENGSFQRLYKLWL
jgi:hypothetical protein